MNTFYVINDGQYSSTHSSLYDAVEEMLNLRLLLEESSCQPVNLDICAA